MATLVRVLGSIFGLFFLIISVPMLIGGIAVLTVPAVIADNQGYMNSPVFHLQSNSSYAFVSQSFKIDTTPNQASNGHNGNMSMYLSNVNYEKIVNIRIKADSYFLGLASTADVQQYLNNVRYVVVSNINENSITTYAMNVDKNGSLLSDPSNQSFWIASGTGVLYFTLKSSDFNKDLTFVVMKADGSKGVDANIQIGVNAPILVPVGVILLVFGSILLIATVVCFVVAYRSNDTKKVIVPLAQIYSPSQTLSPANAPSKYCSTCGTPTDSDANFCIVCGSVLKTH